MTDYYTIISENSVLKAENDRLSLIAESKRAETVRALVVAAWNGGGILPDYHKQCADRAVSQAVALETALIEQAERERLGLGKQAEMSNTHETAHKAG